MGHIRIEGTARTVEFLKHSSGMRNEIARLSVKVATEAKRLCPVGTPESTGKPGYVGGRLRASIGFQVLEGDPRGPVGRIGSGQGGEEAVEYAGYVEFGTSIMEPRPHLRPALTSVVGPMAGGGE